jgi:hypothetical protein
VVRNISDLLDCVRGIPKMLGSRTQIFRPMPWHQELSCEAICLGLNLSILVSTDPCFSIKIVDNRSGMPRNHHVSDLMRDSEALAMVAAVTVEPDCRPFRRNLQVETEAIDIIDRETLFSDMR